METFLAEVARKIYAEHQHDLDHVTVVFNNRRSGLFLRRQFSNMDKQPFFLPKIIGIDELIANLGNLNIVPNEFLLFELFDIHRQLGGEDRKYNTFEDFISFGDMMLADFSEIDLYCVDAQQIFNNLHDLKAIGEWDIETGKLTPLQKQYLQFYHSLFQYYSQLRQRLLSQGKAYSGMAYRHVAENIETLFTSRHANPTYFVGFNALSSSEDLIIKHFIKEGCGTLLTDGDAYYVDDPQQEAGHFLRKYHWNPDHYPEHFAFGSKDITIVSCPENVLQCKYAGQLIAQQQQEVPYNALEQTALVLADESLLLPTLNSLPNNIQTANITMGYPYCSTAVHSLTLKLFTLQQSRRQEAYHHQEILSILTDDIVSKLHGISNIHTRLTAQILQGHYIYATPSEIRDLCTALGGDIGPVEFLFPDTVPDTNAFLMLVRKLVQSIYSGSLLDSNRKEKEALASLLQIVDYFIELQKEYNSFDSLSSLRKIYERIAKRHNIAFYGEPLQGLQILGVLETRNLDFKHLILLSANEGVLPSGKNSNTLIPYSLKAAFGLPTFHEKDAVYAYNFYRLLQRAEKIHILYSTESDIMGKGEPSRFILQLRRELAQRYPNNIVIHEEVLDAINTIPDTPFIIQRPKDEACMRQLQAIAQIGFSPSALNRYRSCPLLFYYENILKIKESDQINEDLEQNELGNCVHEALELIYKTGPDRHILKETLQTGIDNLDEILNRVLEKQFSHGRNRAGRNHYLESVAKSQITNFLRAEIKHLDQNGSIEIIGLEKELKHTLDIEVSGTTQHILIAGRADRIDITDGHIRVVDYKSGKVENKDLHVEDPQPNWWEVPDKWFQVMVYTWLFHYNKDSDLPHLAGIVPLCNFNSSFLAASWEGTEIVTPEHLETFETMLKDILAEILDPTVNFQSNPGCQACNYCPFAETCQR